jgi:hypothetical protein
MLDRLELELAKRLGIGYRDDPVRKRAAGLAMSQARSQFPLEADGSREQVDFAIQRIAEIELEHGATLYARGKAAGAAGYQRQPKCISNPDIIAYHQRRADEQAAAAKAAREPKPLDPYGGHSTGSKYENHRIVSVEERANPKYGDASKFPKTNRNF